MGLLGFLAVFIIAVAVALAGEALTHAEVPFGWSIAILLGLMGGITGTALMGGWGPALAGVYLIPTALGAIAFVALFELTLGAFAPKPSPR